MIITGVVAYLFLHLFPAGKFPSSIDWLQNFAHWDGGWYIGIAQTGYVHTEQTAFFPLYPLLIRLLMVIGIEPILSGLIISNISFLLAIIFLYQLVSNDHGEKIAQKTLWLILAFPVSFFFNMVYSESTNLLFIILFFYFLGKDQWYSALILGALATITHDLGLILALSALGYWWHNRELYTKKTRVLRFISVGIVLIGLIFYMIYLWSQFGTPISFVYAQQHWNRKVVMPVFQLIATLLGVLIYGNDFNYDFVMQINVWFTLLFVALSAPIIYNKTIKLEQKIYYLVTLFACIISGTGGDAQSYARFMLVLFPGFIVLAKLIKNEGIFISMLLLMFTFEVILTGMFVDGYWIT